MGILDFWKKETPQLPTAEQLEEQKKKKLERQRQNDLEDKVRSLDRFPGSLSEYITLKLEEGQLDSSDVIVPMSTGRPKKYVVDPNRHNNSDKNLLLKLVKNGCIGLIRYQLLEKTSSGWSDTMAYGIPVKIKNNGPYR